MLAFRYRFHGHGSLSYVYRRGRREHSTNFSLRLTENKRRTDSRFAVVISKKIHKSAVGRNRVRRRLYEIIRHQLDVLTGVHDVVITVRSAEVINLPHADIESELKQLFKQAGLYSDPI